MAVKVMSYNEFMKYKSEHHNNCCIVISITSTNQDEVVITPNEYSSAKIIKSLHIKANDADIVEKGGLTPLDGLNIARFISNNYSPFIDIIVHCGAGQSRSAGVAAAILKYYTNDDTAIFKNPRYTPNMLFYRSVLNSLYELNSI